MSARRLILIVLIFFVRLIDSNLTDSDLEKISALISATMIPLAEKVELLSAAITPLAEKVELLSADVKLALNESRAAREESRAAREESRAARIEIRDGFRDMRNFGRDRIRVLKLVTHEFSLTRYGCIGSSTRHGFYLGGYVGEIVAPHLDCERVSDGNFSMINASFITHPTKDLGILIGCPRGDYILNISQSVTPELGDEIVSFGYGNFGQAWKGTFSKVHKSSGDSPRTQWRPNGDATDGEYIVQSAQHDGMSGAATSNGCGYLGMARANQPDRIANLALIIAADHIKKFIYKNRDRLMTLDDCTTRKMRIIHVVSLPLSPFMDCPAESASVVQFRSEVGHSEL